MIATCRVMLVALILCSDPGTVFPQQVCPAGCTCRPISGYDYCNDQNFTSVPDNLTSTGTTLDLENNGLSVIRGMEFLTKGGVNIETLFLGHNNIAQLHDEAFKGLTDLSKVYLNNNNITVFDKDLFRNNWKLKFLYLGHNSLTVPGSEDASLLNSASLTYLSLAECNLTRLTRGFFSETPNIIYLYLPYNRLTTLNWATFRHLNRLEDIYIESNPIAHVMCEPQLILSLRELYYARPYIELPNSINSTVPVVNRYTCLELSDNPLVCDCCLILTTYALKKRFKYVQGSCTHQESAEHKLSATEDQEYLKQCFITYMKQLYNDTVGDEEERKIKAEKASLEMEVQRIELEKSKAAALYQKLRVSFDRELDDKFAAEFSVVVAKWVLLGVGAVMTVIGTAVLVLRWRDRMGPQHSDCKKNGVVVAMPPSTRLDVSHNKKAAKLQTIV